MVKEHLYDINASKALKAETVNEIGKLLANGISKTDISKRLKLSPTPVGKYTQKVLTRRRFDTDIGKKVITMVRIGLSRESTAVILDVYYKFVWNCTKRIKRDGNVIFGKRMFRYLASYF